MFSFTLEGADETMKMVDDQINDMATLVAQEDENTIPGEMIKWQVEDMHRKYPNLGQQDQDTYYTEIWPRSRLSLAGTYQRKPKIKLVTLMRKPLTTVKKGAAGVTSLRPILRDELWDKLVNRMIDLLNRVGPWR